MNRTQDWPDILDGLIVEAIKSGKISGEINNVPDKHIESGLAHIFFYGDTVYKLYKSHSDPEHFIKGVLAPTNRRKDFLKHDFLTNQHFSQGAYRNMHSVYLRDGRVSVEPYDNNSIHVVYEMDKLDFSHNLHERLLRKDVSETELKSIGTETARLVSEHDVVIPGDISWYSQAKKRMVFLKQFIDWLPVEYKNNRDIQSSLQALDAHLEKYKEEYETITGSALCADLDNHDENIFIIDGTVKVIDTIPPMDCWWYGVPESNLSSIMANVEALYSTESAELIREAYEAHDTENVVKEHLFEFTRGFNYLISIAHFGSLSDKQEVAAKYVVLCKDIPKRLEAL